MSKLKIYYSVSLIKTQGKNEDMNFIQNDILPKFGEVLPWYGLGDVPDNKIIYNYDLQKVEECDVVIAECSIASHGVGMEIMHAIHKSKPLIIMAKEDVILSKMILGIDYDKFEFFRYKEISEIESKLERALHKVTS